MTEQNPTDEEIMKKARCDEDLTNENMVDAFCWGAKWALSQTKAGEGHSREDGKYNIQKTGKLDKALTIEPDAVFEGVVSETLEAGFKTTNKFYCFLDNCENDAKYRVEFYKIPDDGTGDKGCGCSRCKNEKGENIVTFCEAHKPEWDKDK